MSDVNEVVISGRLTRDCELRQTPNGTSVTDVIVASNRVWSKDSERQEEATFVDVTIWGGQAESLSKYLKKGRHVMIVGRLKRNKWETDEGERRSRLTVVAEKVNLTPGGGRSDDNASSNEQSSKKKDDKVSTVGAQEEVPF